MSVFVDRNEYCKKSRLFFEPSKRFSAQITDLFNETWSFITGLKNFKRIFESAYNRIEDPLILHKLFVDPDDVTNRPDLRKIFSIQSWKDVEFRVSRNLLISLFAHYEAWCDDILDLLKTGFSGKYFQFPYPSFEKKAEMDIPRDYQIVLSQLDVSANMDGLYDVYKKTNEKNYCNADLNNYFKIYRLFKEVRNCIVHCAGIATPQLIAAYSHVSAVHLDVSHVKEQPCIECPHLRNSIDFSLRSVVGFSGILLNIVTTLDVELLHTTLAENFLIKRIREEREGMLAERGIKRYKRAGYSVPIRKIMGELHCKLPDKVAPFASFIKSKGINVSLK